MAALVITIVCIAMIVVGGMTLSQGILTSADTAAINVDKISVTEGEIMRTDLNITRAAQLDWADYVRVTVKNNGQVKLASFDKWDVIVSYIDDNGVSYSKWLPYTAALPGDDEWQKARIGLDGPIDFFEQGILNPTEEMVVLIHVDPAVKDGTNGSVSVAASNGVYSSFPFYNLGYARFTAQSENITLANTKYYELVEAALDDGAAIVSRADFDKKEGGRKLLYTVGDSNRPAQFVYPLIGITSIPTATWHVYYRGIVDSDGGNFPHDNGDTYFYINVLVRKADGSLRATLGTNEATAWVAKADQGIWKTFSGDYSFPGYAVVNGNDYLEIDFYGGTFEGPSGQPGYMQLSIDDNTLSSANQTRIEA
jgi:archaellum component FlaF (FlaF/FlaG flagellin family)